MARGNRRRSSLGPGRAWFTTTPTPLAATLVHHYTQAPGSGAAPPVGRPKPGTHGARAPLSNRGRRSVLRARHGESRRVLGPRSGTAPSGHPGRASVLVQLGRAALFVGRNEMRNVWRRHLETAPPHLLGEMMIRNVWRRHLETAAALEPHPGVCPNWGGENSASVPADDPALRRASLASAFPRVAPPHQNREARDRPRAPQLLRSISCFRKRALEAFQVVARRLLGHPKELPLR
jgi:hypothetical protein